MSEVIFLFRSLRAGSQVFAFLMWFICILCGRVRVCSCYAPSLWYVVLVCHQYDVYKNYVGGVYVGGYDGLSESWGGRFRHNLYSSL